MSDINVPVSQYEEGHNQLKKIQPVQDKLGNINAGLSDLRDEISIFIETVAPVLGPEPALKELNEDNEMPSLDEDDNVHSELTGTLERHAADIRHLIRWVRETRRRVEI